MTAYYNEHDPFCVQWLRNLIDAGLIAKGDVDARDIQEVTPSDLRGYRQHHFFAGIGGWSLALRLADWSDDKPVWTGSCPCQPFSAAGKRAGVNDARHLWPAWFGLIRECQPATIFGEQVEAAIRQGWLDAVFSDLEVEGYACGAAVLPACGVGAPHIRQRLWFVGHAESRDVRLPNGQERRADFEFTGPSKTRQLVDATSEQVGVPRRPWQPRSADWRDAEFIPCTDGKARPVEPGTFPLAHGIPGRVGRLRAYGNAIVPQAATEFIAAYNDLC